MSLLLNAYALPQGCYHELLDGTGRVRAHWRPLFSHLEQIAPARLREQRQAIDQQIQDNGVTYNVYADPGGRDRPWTLDALPQLIPAAEWQTLAQGIAQRATLLNQVLADLYGPQTLLANGLLPTDLIYGHPNFLWPCVGIQPPGGVYLHVYAVDLARAPDGRWWVLADRTQGPSGAGYALENRQIMARVYSGLFRDLQVQALAGFFRTLQDTLNRLAPSDGDAPLCVLLTPGRYNETYFEHLYLARQLGLPLVEGHDLRVRDGTLFLKTLGGLRRVHGVLRRLDDDYCDPLELRSDSALGVPGLLEVARRGRVMIANTLGSGVLESPGLQGFLSGVCEAMLGEPLRLPPVATWWCGEAPARDAVMAGLARGVIKPAFPSQSFEPVFTDSLTPAARQTLSARINGRPTAYVAQERLPLSMTPILSLQEGAARLLPRAMALRAYAVAQLNPATGALEYRVMPGGLTRVAGEAHAAVVSMQRGGCSKDTWVLSEGREPVAPPQRRVIGLRDLVRHDPYLPSSVAEDLFWYGRYAARCEDQARLLRGLVMRTLDEGGDDVSFIPVVHLAQAVGLLPPADAPIASALRLALDREAWSTGLSANLQRLYTAASRVRGRLSQENWQGVQVLRGHATPLEKPSSSATTVLESLSVLVSDLTALSGFALDDMTRDDGWRFLMIGRRIERLQFLCETCANLLREPAIHDPALLDVLLELANSTITYRMRYQQQPQLLPVLDLILCDAQNPHAVLFQLRMLERAEQHLHTAYPGSPWLDLGAQALCAFDFAPFAMAVPHARDGGLPSSVQPHALALAVLLEQIAAQAAQLSNQLTQRYFVHAQTTSLPLWRASRIKEEADDNAPLSD